ncbi:hypothetical protein [Lactobacillus sp. M0390]|uniref:hypothetical protein n=1 Tax=Lactobacillus sp. M0390 TaxID=2751026 RepID=UPI0018DE742F|nr:hypothetical protein [Lactobacillus sp. M0390]MBH9986600.1 hypothetical protein [Lactobacillus sp. M0390]
MQNDEIINILASNIGNQAITIARLQTENSQLKKLLIDANDQLKKKNKKVKSSEHTESNVTD